MQLELNRATFRRLVQLYAASVVLTVGTVVAELLHFQWRGQFSSGYDLVEINIFAISTYNTMQLWKFGALFVVLIWTIVSIAGLFWFKRWSRLGNWASAILGFIILLPTGGYRPSYTSQAFDLLSSIDSGLFASIVLLSYAKGLGADWFGSASTNGKE